MKDRRVRIVVEFDLDQGSLEEKGLTPEMIVDHLAIEKSDTDDTLRIHIRGLNGYDSKRHFVLCNGHVVSKELVPPDNAEEEALGIQLDVSNPVFKKDGYIYVKLRREMTATVKALVRKGETLADIQRRIDHFGVSKYADIEPIGMDDWNTVEGSVVVEEQVFEDDCDSEGYIFWINQ